FVTVLIVSLFTSVNLHQHKPRPTLAGLPPAVQIDVLRRVVLDESKALALAKSSVLQARDLAREQAIDDVLAPCGLGVWAHACEANAVDDRSTRKRLPSNP